jgi:hypothetical protein
VLVEKRLQAGIRDGRITVMFRRWRARQVSAGGIYRTAAGRIAVDEVRVVNPGRITKKDARAAGYATPDEARADLRGDAADPVYLLRIHLVDTPDPRDELAHSDRLTPSDVDDIAARLARLDAASNEGPWTAATLAIIAERPEVRAPDLAATLGRDTAPFKLDVRKLKNLGLTLSFPVGYRLSPRGAAYLAAVRSSPPRTAPR